MNEKLLHKIDNLVQGTILNRPSKNIKSPYVADVLLENNEEIIAHSPSLGCCGLADKKSCVLMEPIQTEKCSHRIILSIYEEEKNNNEICQVIVGIYPKFAELLVENALKSNLISILQNIVSYKRETKIFIEGRVDSRFDFSGIDSDNRPFVLEVKNVPLADYEDILAKERKNKDYSSRDFNSKVAYFPDGYRKKKGDPISPRALKHIRELTILKKEYNKRCILCFVVQRTDIERFQPSTNDPEYRKAILESMEAGVEIIVLVIKWTKDGEAIFVKDDLLMTFNDS